MKWALALGLYALGMAWLVWEARHPLDASAWLARRCIYCGKPTSEEDGWRLANGATLISGICPDCRQSHMED